MKKDALDVFPGHRRQRIGLSTAWANPSIAVTGRVQKSVGFVLTFGNVFAAILSTSERVLSRPLLRMKRESAVDDVSHSPSWP